MEAVRSHRFAVVGDRVHHSLSPLIHNASARVLGADFSYCAELVEPDGFLEFIEAFRKGNTPYSGISVTVPFKQEAYRLCDELSDLAKSLASVNTISLVKGKLIGDNTDWIGFYAQLSDLLPNFKAELPAAIIGTGGVARTCVHALKEFGFTQIFICSRTLARASEFIQEWDHLGIDLIPTESLEGLGRFALIVNASPLGFNDTDAYPVSPDIVSNSCDSYYDLVYRMGEHTPLVKIAEDKGISCQSGVRMLVRQAVEAELIWNKHLCVFPDSSPAIEAQIFEAMTEAIESISERRHISLVGFMGSGKTSIAETLSKENHIPWVDLDRELEKRVGMSVMDIFASEGEERFRTLEHEVLQEVLCRPEPHIISCGGGITTNPHNQSLLSFNSRVVYLELSISDLYERLKMSHAKYPRKRPLLQEGIDFETIAARFAKREQSYLQCADIILPIDNKGTRQKDARALAHRLKL